MILLGTIPLPDDLEWVDEFEWTPVEDSIDTALSGSLVIQTGTRPKGRPITLTGTNDNTAWITRAVLEDVKALADSNPSSVALDYHGRIFNVRFRYSDKPYSARPVMFRSGEPADDDRYTIIIRLMEI